METFMNAFLFLYSCGIALDAWMFPLEDDIYTTGIEQPLQFINTYEFQWKENVAKIMKLLKPVNEAGKTVLLLQLL